MPKIILIANTKSGSNLGWSACEDAVKAHEIFEVHPLQEGNLDAVIGEAWEKGSRTFIAAGGDGTVSYVASTLMRLGLPGRLAVLPIGTLNHFAKDIGIPLDLENALSVIENGQTIEIDIAKVNDIYFINNSSVGLYPELVKARQNLERYGIGKWVALGRVILTASFRRFIFTVRFGKGSDLVPKRLTSIFIGNNRYSAEGATIGSREKMDDGVLFVALLKSETVFGIAKLFIKALFGAALLDIDLNVIGLSECTIDSARKQMLVSFDGEIASLTPPLHYTIVKKALKVIVPNA